MTAVYLGGEDIIDRTIDVGEGTTRTIEIVLTNRVTEVAGAVRDDHGRPAGNCPAAHRAAASRPDPSRWLS